MEMLATTSAISRNYSLENLRVTSSAFQPGGAIPLEYSCEGKNVNPPLAFYGIPKETVSITIIMTDIDAPLHPWAHWVVWNIPTSGVVVENLRAGVQGLNDYGKIGYSGCFSSKPLHHYLFEVFALDTMLDICKLSNQCDLQKAIGGHVLATGNITGCSMKSINHKYFLL